MGATMFLVFSKRRKHLTRFRFLILIVTFLAYLVLGSYVNSILNINEERELTNEIISFRADFYAQHTCVDKDLLERLVKEYIKASSSGIHAVESQQNYTQIWRFGGDTVFFAFTLLSTIGYGHMAPNTTLGRLFCTIYLKRLSLH